MQAVLFIILSNVVAYFLQNSFDRSDLFLAPLLLGLHVAWYAHLQY
ncbi:MAG: hypothetical protein IBX44_02070 [Sulfurospirillum sp.]|nr:hypothetical protein [Sulfurospirillum sp.]